jgi:hypothetical protein
MATTSPADYSIRQCEKTNKKKHQKKKKTKKPRQALPYSAVEASGGFVEEEDLVWRIVHELHANRHATRLP